MSIKFFEGARVQMPASDIRQGNYGPYRIMTVAHPDLPKNTKGYNEVKLFPTPDDAVCALRKGDLLDVVYDETKNKYTGQVSQNQPQQQQDSNKKPARLSPTDFAKVYAKCYKATEQALEEEGYPTLSEETLRSAAATVFIQYTKTNL